VTIKSDRWIRRMVLEQGMIEPFVESQVRDGVISYGLSSYGYDMRIANEFKVFTNVFNTLVDPKHFDPRSFVDITGDYCDIPPNSFALARSVELFRIPRNVLAVCLGKSTYARCFRGDTRVALVNNSNPTFYDLAERAQAGERFWGYGIDSNRRMTVTELVAPRWVARDPLIEIELDTGECIQCTPEHRMLLRNGMYEQAANIRPGDRLMPLYRSVRREYEAVMHLDGSGWYPTHRLADDWNIRNGVYDAERMDFDRHHRDGNRRNNRPTNLMRMDSAEHAKLHNQLSAGSLARQHAQQRRVATERTVDPQGFVAKQRSRARRFWDDTRYEERREHLIQQFRKRWAQVGEREIQSERLHQYYDAHPDARVRAGERSRQAWQGASSERRERQRELGRQLNPGRDISEADVLAALRAAGSVRGAARLLDCDRTVFRRFVYVIEGWCEEHGPTQHWNVRTELTEEMVRQALDETDGSVTAAAAFLGCSRTVLRKRFLPTVEQWKADRRNHVVTAVRSVAGEHDVFCVTAPETENFALACGVFVHNCGIIVNTTPFEPGWRGYVTIELSNSTPLPARIYANEGIGQVLFFESDEQCEISYDEKQGKYLDQVGVVPPRL
jgi:deoxycytidine triphosphate deaminase